MQYCYNHFCLTKVLSFCDYLGKTMKLTMSDILVSISGTIIRRLFVCLFVYRRHKAFTKKSIGHPKLCKYICKNIFQSLRLCFILAILVSSKPVLICCSHLWFFFFFFFKCIPVFLSI